MSGASGVGPNGLVLRGLVRRGDFALAVDLSVAAGEVVALSGPNGVGKTTVLRFVAGLGGTLDALPGDPATPSAGPGPGPRFLLDGEDLRAVPSDRRGLAVVFQEPRLVAHMTALDNVAFAATLGGVPKPRARTLAAALLDELGLPREKHRLRPAHLSGGQRARTSMARALAVSSPRLRLLDEPLAAIDAPSRPLLREVLAAHLRGSDAPTLLVTHDPADAEALAGRAIALDTAGDP